MSGHYNQSRLRSITTCKNNLKLSKLYAIKLLRSGTSFETKITLIKP